jgi:hypothetical protein
MNSWITVAILYALGMGCFRLLGGFRAAGDALRRWGRASAVGRTGKAPLSS